jgi:hypothetical protein
MTCLWPSANHFEIVFKATGEMVGRPIHDSPVPAIVTTKLTSSERVAVIARNANLTWVIPESPRQIPKKKELPNEPMKGIVFVTENPVVYFYPIRSDSRGTPCLTNKPLSQNRKFNKMKLP